MLWCLYDGSNCLVSGRAFAAAQVHGAIAGESIAVISVVAGVGRGRMTRDQTIDRESVLNGAQSIFKGSKRCRHVVSPVRAVLGSVHRTEAPRLGRPSGLPG